MRFNREVSLPEKRERCFSISTLRIDLQTVIWKKATLIRSGVERRILWLCSRVSMPSLGVIHSWIHCLIKILMMPMYQLMYMGRGWVCGSSLSLAMIKNFSHIGVSPIFLPSSTTLIIELKIVLCVGPWKVNNSHKNRCILGWDIFIWVRKKKASKRKSSKI